MAVKKKFPVQLDEETKQYCQQEADRLGISISGLINVAISQYRQQNQVMDIFNNMPGFLKQFENLQRSLGDGKGTEK